MVCVLCGSDQAAVSIAAKNFDPQPGNTDAWFHVVRCRTCGLEFTNPRPSSALLPSFYPPHYYAYQPTGLGSAQHPKKLWERVEAWTKVGIRRAFYGYPAAGGAAERWLLRCLLWPLWLRMRWLGKDLKIMPYRGQGRFLEVGCGTGSSLAYQREYGLTVAGVEWNASAARAARERYGLDVRAGTLEEAKFPSGSFDVIFMSHVFEHLPNPAAALDEMHRILEAGGLVILKVPSISSASAQRFGPHWLGLDLPRHLYHFSPSTITRLLEQHGFAVRAVRQDVGSWGWWRESRRLRNREASGGEQRDQNVLDQAREMWACWRGRGSVIVAVGQKED